MATKPKLKYRIVAGKKPGTQITVLRPQITERETYYIDQVVSYAIGSGYVRGQFEDMKGALNGFIEAIQALGKAGKAVNLANWLRVHAELTGSVGEDRQLTEQNELNVNITALTDLKASVSDFSWTNVDDTGVTVKVDSLLSVGGTPGTVVRGDGIVATGRNLQYDASLGDAVTVTCNGVGTPIALVPTESDYAHQKFAWPAALDNVAAGTVLTFTFKLRGGIEGAPDQTVPKTAVLVGEVPVTPTITSVQQTGRAEPNQIKLSPSVDWVINGTDLAHEGDTVWVELYSNETGELIDWGNQTSGDAPKIVSSTSTKITLNGVWWESKRPDGEWYEAYPRTKVVIKRGDTRIEFPMTFTEN